MAVRAEIIDCLKDFVNPIRRHSTLGHKNRSILELRQSLNSPSTEHVAAHCDFLCGG